MSMQGASNVGPKPEEGGNEISVKALPLDVMSAIAEQVPADLPALRLASRDFRGGVRSARIALRPKRDISNKRLTALGRLFPGATALDLTGSTTLTSSCLLGLPALFPGLQSLKLNECWFLSGLPDSVISSLPSLTELEFTGCNGLPRIPESLFKLSNLRKLALKLPGLTKLPDNYTQLSTLHELRLPGCSSLRCLPEDFGFQLSALRVLDLEDCASLPSLPDSIGSLSLLRKVNLMFTTKLESLPVTFTALESLEELGMDCSISNFDVLPVGFSKFTGLQRLDLSNCSSMRYEMFDFLRRYGFLREVDSLDSLRYHYFHYPLRRKFTSVKPKWWYEWIADLRLG